MARIRINAIADSVAEAKAQALALWRDICADVAADDET